MTRAVAVALWLIIFALLLFYTLAAARAHDSWINHERLTDPVSKEWCCNLVDCREETANVERVVAGFYIKDTGEIIPPSRVIWRSPGGWWRCRYLGGENAGKTRCLIGPPPGS